MPKSGNQNILPYTTEGLNYQTLIFSFHPFGEWQRSEASWITLEAWAPSSSVHCACGLRDESDDQPSVCVCVVGGHL